MPIVPLIPRGAAPRKGRWGLMHFVAVTCPTLEFIAESMREPAQAQPWKTNRGSKPVDPIKHTLIPSGQISCTDDDHYRIRNLART